MDVAGPDGRPKRVKVTIWDTGMQTGVYVFMLTNCAAICLAGQERFRSLIPSYIRDSSVAVVVYDITSS